MLLGLIAVGSPQKYREEFHPANETGRLHAAMAVVDHGTLFLDVVWDDVYPGWRQSGRLPNADAAVLDERYLLDKPPGVTLLAVPLVAIFRATGYDPPLATWLWILALLLAALPAALFLLFFLRFLGKNLPDGTAAVLVAPAVVLATPWLLFGSHAGAHSLAAALAGVGLVLALGRLGAEASEERVGRSGFLGGLALGWAVVTEASCLLLVLAAVVALAVDGRRRRRLPWFLLGGVAPALAFLGWNALAFGDPFSYGYAHTASLGMAEAHGLGFFGVGLPRWEALYGLFLSARPGLFFLAPWLLLAPVGAVWAVATGPSPAPGACSSSPSSPWRPRSP